MTCPDRSVQHPTAPGEGTRTAGPVRIRLGILFLWVAALGVGCAEPGGSASPALTRDEFIDVVVAIRQAELDLERSGEEGDTAAARFQALRDSILASHGTVPEDLYEFLGHHTDLRYMNEVWDSITQRLKRPLRSRELPPEPGEDNVGRQEGPPTRPDDDRRTRLRSGG